jgi:diguanylate cyclase (GGDEF)-like protein
VIALAPVEFASGRDNVTLWAATDVRTDVPLDAFVVEDGVRQTVVGVAGTSGLYVVARTVDAVHLPSDEYTFYLIIFSLAVALLLLASATILAEQRSLLERASFDPLTRLPNRSEFERRGAEVLTNAGRSNAHVCVLLFDLNGFKLVNDTYGHTAGDQMLQIVADRLRKAVRDDDVVARWGGDEFVVAMPGIESEEMSARRARQLADAVGGRTRLDGVPDPLRVRVSVGVALWPDHGDDLEALIEAADKAMYQAKREGLVSRMAVPPSDELDISALGLHGVRSPR